MARIQDRMVVPLEHPDAEKSRIEVEIVDVSDRGDMCVVKYFGLSFRSACELSENADDISPTLTTHNSKFLLIFCLIIYSPS